MTHPLLIPTLERLLSVKRPYGGRGEGAAVLDMFRLAPPRALSWVDGAGNLHVDMRETDKHRTLFIAHMDTMHKNDGLNSFTLQKETGMYFATDDVLGADDGAGASILACLMQAIPAYYVFCRGEERGGVGSKYIAEHFPKLLGRMDRAIAFDRRGSSDIITHQSGSRCASDEFGEALSTALNDQGLLYMPCDGGVYTDTAEFVDLIPECTNISCGYQFEHSNKEQLNGEYLKALCAAALNVQWDDLPVVRDPSIDEDFDLPFFNNVLKFSKTDWESEVEEAVGSALDNDPRALMKLVAKDMKLPIERLDSTLFEAHELVWHIDRSSCWDDVIVSLAESCSDEMVH